MNSGVFLRHQFICCGPENKSGVSQILAKCSTTELCSRAHPCCFFLSSFSYRNEWLKLFLSSVLMALALSSVSSTKNKTNNNKN